MNMCSPVEMRKNLVVVDEFKIAMIDFVVMPVKDEAHKLDLIAQGQAIFQEMIKEGES